MKTLKIGQLLAISMAMLLLISGIGVSVVAAFNEDGSDDNEEDGKDPVSTETPAGEGKDEDDSSEEKPGEDEKPEERETDSDGDGFSDGLEKESGTDPYNEADSPEGKPDIVNAESAGILVEDSSDNDNTDNGSEPPHDKPPGIGDAKLEVGSTEDFGGGDFVAIRVGKDSWFAVVYGTEEDPNAVTLVSMYTRYLGVADVNRRDDKGKERNEKGTGIPVQTVFAQRLDYIFEFRDINDNSAFDFYKIDEMNSGDEREENDKNDGVEDKEGVNSGEESTRDEGNEKPGDPNEKPEDPNEKPGEPRERPELKETREPIIKAVDLIGSWDLSRPTLTESDEKHRVWEFRLTRKELPYQYIGDDKNEGPANDRITLEKVEFTFHVKVSVENVSMDDIPYYDINMTEDGIKTTLKGSEKYQGHLITADFKFDHDIEGWDPAPPVDDQDPVESKLMLETHTLMGNHISAYVASWLKGDLLDMLKGGGQAEYADDNEKKHKIEGEEGKDDPVVINSGDRKDIKELGSALENGKISLSEFFETLLDAYKHHEITKYDLRDVYLSLYKSGTLEDKEIIGLLFKMKEHRIIAGEELIWILTEMVEGQVINKEKLVGLLVIAYQEGFLHREEFVDILIFSREMGFLTQDDLVYVLTELGGKDAFSKDEWKDILIDLIQKGWVTKEEWVKILLASYHQARLDKEALIGIIEKLHNNGIASPEDTVYVLSLLYFHGILTKEEWVYIVLRLHKNGVIDDKFLIIVFFEVYEKGGLDRNDLISFFALLYKEKIIDREHVTKLIVLGFNMEVLSHKDLVAVLIHAHSNGMINKTEVLDILWLAFRHSELPPEEWLIILTHAYHMEIITKEDWFRLVFRSYEKDEVGKDEMMRFMLLGLRSDIVSMQDWIGMISVGFVEGTFDAADIGGLLSMGYQMHGLTRRDILLFILQLHQKDIFSDEDVSIIIMHVFSGTRRVGGENHMSMDLRDLRFMLMVPYARGNFSLNVVKKALIAAHEHDWLTDHEIEILLRDSFFYGLINVEDVNLLLADLKDAGALPDSDVQGITRPSPQYKMVFENITNRQDNNRDWIDNILTIYINRVLARDDVRRAVFIAHQRGNITFDDLYNLSTAILGNETLLEPLVNFKWFVFSAYANEEIDLIRLKFLVLTAYAGGQLSLGDLRWILVDSFHKNQLTREEIRWIIFTGFDNDLLSREDLCWILFRSHKLNDITFKDLVWMLMEKDVKLRDLKWFLNRSFSVGDINISVLRGLLVEAYRAGRFTQVDILHLIMDIRNGSEMTVFELKWLIVGMYMRNELHHRDLNWLLFTLYRRGHINRITIRWILVSAWEDGDFSLEDLRKLLFHGFHKGELNRTDLKWIIITAYVRHNLTRKDLGRLIIRAYEEGELTRKDLRWILFMSYKLKELTREDLRWLLIHAHMKGELKREDLRWILIHAYKEGELTREDLKLLIIEAYKSDELTREDLRWLLMMSYKRGNLTMEDVKWILFKAYAAGELSREDLAEIIVHALKAGELQKEDLVKLIKMALDAGELKLEDISFILKIGHKFRIFNEDTIHHLLTRLHQEGSLTGEDILLILVLVRRDGDLSEKVMVHILIKALGEGFLDKEKFAKMLKWAFKQGHIGEDEIRFILEWAYRHGEEFNITKEDIEALLNRLHKDEIVRMIKLMDIIDAKAIERNTIQFADNWQRVGKMTWVSDVEVWSDANSNESYTVPAYFQVHGVEKVLELVDWVHHRNMTKGVFFGFMMKGGYLYPAAHRVFHDPNFVGEVNYFSPPGADQVVPDKIDDTGKIEYDDFDSVSEANIPLNKDEVVEVEFKNRQGQKVVCKFKGEGTVSWQWVEDSDIPDKANSDVPEGRITIGNFIVADIEGKLDWFYMEIHYDDADIPDTVNEADLMLYYWDEDSNGWQKCENTKVDTLNNIVYANVTHFTIFAPMAEQKQVGSDAGKDDGVSVLIMVLILLVVVFLIATIIAMFVRKKKDDTGLDVSEKDLPINEDDADWDRYQE